MNFNSIVFNIFTRIRSPPWKLAHFRYKSTSVNMSPSKTTTKSTKSSKPSGPGYAELIASGISTMKERSGSSRQALDKFVSSKKGETYSKLRLNAALKKGVEVGTFVQLKGSYKLPSKKTTAAKTATAKSATVKKTTTKKVSVKKTTAKAAPAKKAAAKKKSPAKKKVVKKKVVKKSPKKKAAKK